jgi:hypothetical protein
MEVPFAGGCACGAVRFECRSEPIAMYNCHCPGCQKIHGAPFAPLLVLPSNMTVFLGEQRKPLRSIRDDKHARRSSCPQCGSPLLSHSVAMPDIVLINAMSLDDPGWFCPTADIWTVNVRPWVQLDRHIPKVFKSTPVLGGEIV